MNAITRRSLLRSILGCLGITGTVVLARATPAAASESKPASDVVRRADEVARDLPADPDHQVRQLFLNRGGGGGLWGGGRGLWRNGGWPNGGRGGVAWGNGGGHGVWRNGGGWPNGAWHNGWFNGGWHNWW